MEKPLVLKRRIRLSKWQIGFYVLWFGVWIWWLPQNVFGASVGLLSFALFNAHHFLRRVTLASNKISIWDDEISNRVIRFERMTRCSIESDNGKVNVELTLQHWKAPSYAIFGNRPIGAPQRLTRVISFSIEPGQLDALKIYLNERDVPVETTPVRANWSEHYLAKRARLLRNRDDLSDEEKAEILREIEDELIALNKY